ncbi:hypothetical protein ACGF5S_31285 [Nocardia nova]|uniref:hypothetical protein n=1 Tax=Nocardia nova TaxID=37330 RepID=UPI00372320E1
MDDRTRCTEVNGLEAVWTMQNYRHIEIRQARDMATGDVIEFAPGTDLAAAREQTSRRWAAVWDRVAHQMWTEWIPGHRDSEPAPMTRYLG